MCLREYSEDEIKEMFRRDGYEDGKLEGKLEDIRKIMEKKGLSAEEAMDIFDIPEKERPTIAKMI